jgi:hypothetical protein
MQRGLVRMGMRNTFLAGLLALLLAQCANSCTWAAGYFYQVTSLKGRVVGTTWHGMPRWLRQSFAVKHVTLKLYEYQGPAAPREERPALKTVETDDSGNFDFGALRIGHYFLSIEGRGFGDGYDVEIKEDLPRATGSILIDASPVLPDCTGGHEFIVSEK